MITQMMPTERVLWRGRPSWGAVARDVLYMGWLAGYVALLLIWHAADNRAAGLDSMATLMAGIPLAVLCLLVLVGLASFAWLVARTTTYTVTSERCILEYGVALTATLSIPHRKVAAISIAVHGDHSGDLLLQMKPAPRMGFLKLWPHVRPWRFRQAQPMLRGVPDVAKVAMLLSEATAAVSAGVVHALPEVVAAPAVPDLFADATLSPAGD